MDSTYLIFNDQKLLIELDGKANNFNNITTVKMESNMMSQMKNLKHKGPKKENNPNFKAQSILLPHYFSFVEQQNIFI